VKTSEQWGTDAKMSLKNCALAVCNDNWWQGCSSCLDPGVSRQKNMCDTLSSRYNISRVWFLFSSLMTQFKIKLAFINHYRFQDNPLLDSNSSLCYVSLPHSEPSFVKLSISCSLTYRTPEGLWIRSWNYWQAGSCTWLSTSSAKKCDPDQGHQTAKGDILLPLGLQVIRHRRWYTVRCQNVLSSSLRSFCLEDNNLSDRTLVT
jgi:hypothetical protein